MKYHKSPSYTFEPDMTPELQKSIAQVLLFTIGLEVLEMKRNSVSVEALDVETKDVTDYNGSDMYPAFSRQTSVNCDVTLKFNVKALMEHVYTKEEKQKLLDEMHRRFEAEQEALRSKLVFGNWNFKN